ncbi:MAG TPA: prolipoprotein diacylglyceryl transferase [Gemmatimonadales bacterium]|jgi:phosphatidylglycerol:prolipoprotein diacylglycerol transferase
MTLQPLILKLGFITITGYGIMMAVGFLVAGWVIYLELKRRGLSDEFSSDIIVAGVIGGVAGAKIWYAVLYHDAGALFSRGGLVWYGGFLGGATAVLLNAWRQRVPVRFTLEISAPALALGYAIGRIGCFLVEDDYGVPTSLPWGMKFPNGLPPTTAANLQRLFHAPVPATAQPYDVLAVHPTQLYEVLAMSLVFWILWRLRPHHHATGWLFGVYLMFAGVERFLIEFIRAKDDRMLAGFTLAQAASVAAVVLGVVLMRRWAKPDGFTLPEEAKVLRRLDAEPDAKA